MLGRRQRGRVGSRHGKREVAMAVSPNERQRGFALLVVLWIVTLLALQISIFNLSVRDAGALAGNELAMARGEALAAAGVEMAAARLMEPPRMGPSTEWQWSADGRTRQVSYGGARLFVTITDEAGRFDINELDGEVLDSLLRPFGGSADAVTTWLDQNGPFVDPTQLADAVGLPASALQSLAPYLTVHGGDGRINPLAASREALQMLPGADLGEIEQALALRRRDGVTAADVARLLTSVDKWLTERTGPAYRVEVAVRGESMPAIGWAEATILIGKDAAAPFRVLSWRYAPTAAPESQANPVDQVRDQR
jgi:general secretion pathway protein K